MEPIQLNITTPGLVNTGAEKVIYVEHTVHAISLGEVVAAIGGYAILVYYWILVNRDKVGYSHWKNPKGREVNLFKIIQRLMIWYPIVIIILAALQIYLNMHMI